MTKKITLKETTNREGIELLKFKDRQSYYGRKYCGYQTTSRGKKSRYIMRSLGTTNLDEARQKILNFDFGEYEPSDKPSAFGVRLKTMGYEYIPEVPYEIGAFGENIFIGKMCDQGYEVYQPKYDKWGADFVVCKNGKYSKVQVKTTTTSDFRINLHNRAGLRYVEHVDYIALMSLSEKWMYYIPTSNIPLDAQYLTSKNIRNFRKPLD